MNPPLLVDAVINSRIGGQCPLARGRRTPAAGNKESIHMSVTAERREAGLSAAVAGPSTVSAPGFKACVVCRTARRSEVLFEYGRLPLHEVLEESGGDPHKVIDLGPQLLTRVLRCGDCGLVYMDERIRPQDLTAFYDRMGDIYEFYTYDEQSAIADKVAIVNTYAGASRGRFLDIGCARGDLLKALRDKGFDCYGVEISRGAVDIGRRDFGLNLFAGTLDEAAYPDDHFDWVSAGDVVEHLQDPAAMIKEIARILRPSGRIIIEVPSEATIFRRVARSIYRVTGGRVRGPLDKLYNPFHLSYFSPKSMRRALENAGLTVLQMDAKESYTTAHGRYAKSGLKRLPIRVLVQLDRLLGTGAKLVVCATKA